jgi:hypothetical protein
MENEWEARDLFINVYKELCEDELNRTLIWGCEITHP